MARKPHLAVIGAGIIGASIAYHIVKAGGRVTVLASSPPGGVATGASFGWINASWGNDPTYFRLRTESLRCWQRLHQEIPGLGVSWGGSLTYDLSSEALKAYVREFAALGYPVRLVDRREITALEPALSNAPAEAAYAEAEGSAEPIEATRAFLAAAGIEPLRTVVHGIDPSGSRVAGVMTEEGAIAADGVVVAAGTNTSLLLSTLGVRLALEEPPGLLVRTKAMPRLLRRLVIAPEIHLRQGIDGSLIAGSDFGGSPIDRGPSAVAAALVELIRATVRGAEGAELDRYTIGYRPTTKDERPIIGPVSGLEGLYVAVMHSGITNAPAVGAFAAAEILTGERHPLIRPYGIDRFG